MKWRVLVSAPYLLPVLDEYRPVLEKNGIEAVPATVVERLEEDDLLAQLGNADGAICGDDRFTERVLRAAPNLKVISKWGTGIDSIDVEAARRLGIGVYNTPGAFTQPVADTVLGYILAFARRLPWLDRDMKESRWSKHMGISLQESTIGVVGVGAIGQAVIRRGRAFGATLLGNDITEVPGSFLNETSLQMVPLDELLAQSDFISLNCTLNPTSYHLIGRRQLRLMKQSAYLINTCRGPVLEEAALIEALQQGWIAGAALDVFEEEPLPADSPLRSMDNCLLAPHNANSSPVAWGRVHDNTIRNLIEGLNASR